MRIGIVLAGLFLAASPTALAAKSDKIAVRELISAIKRGEDLSAAYPSALSEREIASLRRVAKCQATNLMKQESGRFTVVWVCGLKGALGMEVLVRDGKVTSVSTFEVERRAN